MPIWSGPLIVYSIIKMMHFNVRVKNTEISNYFLASAPGNPGYKKMIDLIMRNIQERDVKGRVYYMTGPDVFNEILEGKAVASRSHRHLCIQGSFTNEHFQYLDKPQGKWVHTKLDDILKKEQ